MGSDEGTKGSQAGWGGVAGLNGMRGSRDIAIRKKRMALAVRRRPWRWGWVARRGGKEGTRGGRGGGGGGAGLNGRRGSRDIAIRKKRMARAVRRRPWRGGWVAATRARAMVKAAGRRTPRMVWRRPMTAR